MNAHYNRFRRLCAWLIGATFVISGTLKLMDPTGTGLIVNEYWKFLHIGFLRFASVPLGTLLALAEAVTGVALITGVWRKVTAVITAAMLGFFTVISIVLVIFNPSMDCGCFGEAIHLTHLQTLVKNVVLDILAAASFIPMRDFGEPRKLKYGTFALVSASLLAFCIYSFIALPMKDFTDFRPGAQILAARSEADEIVYEAVFIYEKDGRFKAFSLEDLPDSTWRFVTSKARPSKDMYPIANLSFSDPEKTDEFGNAIYLDSLAAAKDVVIVSVYDKKRMSQKKINEVRTFLADAELAGYDAYMIVAHSDKLPEGAYRTDFKTAISLNRSNSGATLIQDGFIIRKWRSGHYPSTDDLAALLDVESADTMLDTQSKGDIMFQSFLLYISALLILL